MHVIWKGLFLTYQLLNLALQDGLENDLVARNLLDHVHVRARHRGHSLLSTGWCLPGAFNKIFLDEFLVLKNTVKSVMSG